ncbi:MAG: hypothetical protein AB1778_05865 [Candidatus Bipolaricaulota bacterium]
MNRETLPAVEQHACGAGDTAPTHQPTRGGWFIRAAAVAYVVVNAIIAYCILSPA